jgi:hypothetical protein
VIASDPDVARRAGMEAENTKDVPLIRYLMHKYRLMNAGDLYILGDPLRWQSQHKSHLLNKDH